MGSSALMCASEMWVVSDDAYSWLWCLGRWVRCQWWTQAMAVSARTPSWSLRIHRFRAPSRACAGRTGSTPGAKQFCLCPRPHRHADRP